jgi:chorismate-pyruvate lyase
MTSRARRLRGRHEGHWRPPVTDLGATDEFAGLGRVEQLVLRGDGLTTTSLEILTGQRISVEVVGHWVVAVPAPEPSRSVLGSMPTGLDGPDLEDYLATARARLEAVEGDLVLVRDVLLVGSAGAVFGSAEVVGLLRELPAAVAHALASTDQPIGRLLREHDVPVVRELHRWGHLVAGPQAHRLDSGLTPSTRVPGREYLMRNSASGRPLAVLTERFAPHVFAPAAPAVPLRRVH